MATTHDGTSLTQFVKTVPVYGGDGEGFGAWNVLRFFIDMSAIHDSLGATIDGSAADVLNIWDIPAGTTLFSSGCIHTIKPEGSACTVQIGDIGDPNGFLTATSINTTNTWTTFTGAYAVTTAFGYYYATATALDLTFGTHASIDTAVFEIFIPCLRVKPVGGTIYNIGPTPGS